MTEKYMKPDIDTKRIPLFIDCDTGVDDAMALLCAAKMNSFDLIGVAAVAGNVGLENTLPNTLNVLALAGRTDVPVYKGAEKPLARPLVTAPHVHGLNGLGGVELDPSPRKAESEPAWDGLYNAAIQYENLVLVAVGPLTNVAKAFIKYRDLPKRLSKVVIMGGAAVGGNRTPSAEFNVITDPEAADVVFNSGIPVVMCGLDVTLKAYLTEAELDELAELGTPQAIFSYQSQQNALRYELSLGLPGICLHDPAALFFAEDESMFTARKAGIRVETRGLVTSGKTVTDLDSDKKMPYREHRVVLDIDREAFRGRLFALMRKYCIP